MAKRRDADMQQSLVEMGRIDPLPTFQPLVPGKKQVYRAAMTLSGETAPNTPPRLAPAVATG
jgi:hypothetical protein